MTATRSEIMSPAKGALIVGLFGFLALISEFLPIISLPLLLLAWAVSYGAFFVFPVIYFLTARFGTRSANYPKYVAAAVLILAGLNCWYLSNAWALGLKWQSAQYTYAVTALNLVYFGLITVAAYFGVREDSKKAAQIAHLGLFVALSFGAFPVLGELP